MVAGDLMTLVAAWYQSPTAIAFGLAIILAAWTYGLLFFRFSDVSGEPSGEQRHRFPVTP
jgi:hypothetical protein